MPSFTFPQDLLYFVPFLPVAVYLVILISFSDILDGVLKAGERDTDRHRSVLGILAGFAFTGIAAIAVLKTVDQKELGLEISLYYLIVSFLCYLMALNLESYKIFVYHYLLGNLLTDMADLAFLCCVLSFVNKIGFSETGRWIFFVIVIGIWFLHYAYLIWLQFQGMGSLRVRILQDEQAAREQQNLGG